MQRKNYLLKNSHKNGMAMIMAIIVLIVIATVMSLSLAMTVNTAKKTTDIYLYEQATILSHSAAEYAVLRASQVNPCSFSGDDFPYNATYDINISMRYIAFTGSSCDGNATANNTSFSIAGVKQNTNHAPSDGTIIMDITVSTTNGVSTEPIRYFRRSIQKM